MSALRDRASFRDEAGHVFHLGERVLRSVRAGAAQDYARLRDEGVFSSLADRGLLIESRDVPVETLGGDAVFAVEHPRLPFISYPYEWCFRALRSAALLTLDLHLELLASSAGLVDASAFNVQFLGARPIFIDMLSVRGYQDGDYWRAQKQFCQHFLNPLLLRVARGVAHNAWFRGTLDGIPTRDAVALLPWRWKMRWQVLSNLVIPEYLQSRHGNLDSNFDPAKVTSQRLPRTALTGILQGARDFVAKLGPSTTGAIWQDYERFQTYTSDEKLARDAAIRDFAARYKPKMLWDVGCNTGHFSILALDSGAGNVIGFDSDPDAVDTAFARSEARKLNFTPLVMDASNQSPAQGWRQEERGGLASRQNADAMIALAFIHHLAIGRNVPLDEVVDWLVSLAPVGIIEFVPKADPTVQKMLALRTGAEFSSYDEAGFVACLERRAQIVRRTVVSSAGRCLFEYRRPDDR